MNVEFSSADTSEDSLAECPVCLEEVHSLWPLSCGHAFCRNCIEAHVKSRVAENDALHLRCLNPICRVAISNEDVRFVCVADVFAQFMTQCAELRALQSSKRTIFCSTPSCDNRPLIFSSADEKERFCDVCERWTCVVCGGSHSPNSACLPPPPGCLRCPLCAATCFKVTGCNLVKCASCSANFCAVCQKHTPNGYKHFDEGECKGRLGNPACAELCLMLYMLCCCLAILFFLVPFVAFAFVIEFVVRLVKLRRMRREREARRANMLITV
jgi:hypothetical protein